MANDPLIFDWLEEEIRTKHENLRIDNVNFAVEQIAETLSNIIAVAGGAEVNSLIQLLGVMPAKITSQTELTNEGSLLLQTINSIGQRIVTLENIFGRSIICHVIMRGKSCLLCSTR